MTLLHDYVYRFSSEHLPVAGRCRVRIYGRKAGTRTVLLTELHDNPGESISDVCERIATDLAARWKFDVQTTRWLQQDAPLDHLPSRFDEVVFTWNSDQTAAHPHWQSLNDDQAEDLTGDLLSALYRRIGDSGY